MRPRMVVSSAMNDKSKVAPKGRKQNIDVAPKGRKRDERGTMKSAYELALERLESQGIERPREEALSEAERDRVAEARRKAEAKIAEMEILHQGRLEKLADPAERELAEKDFRHERRRVEEKRDREIERIREH